MMLGRYSKQWNEVLGALQAGKIRGYYGTFERGLSQSDASHSFYAPRDFAVTLGRAIDKILTGIGVTIQFFIYLTLFILFGIYVLPVIELLLYAGGILWLAGGLIVIVLVLFHGGVEATENARIRAARKAG